MFSEFIWIYFLIAIFTGVEWDQIVYIYPLWWIIAAIGGYMLNAILGGRINYILLLIINGSILGAITFKNWQIAIQEGSFFYTISTSLAVCFIFIRSASFVYKESTRAQMLLRFEGNVVIYILFSVVFFMNKWDNSGFHLAFLFAIFTSLIGMILTLQREQTDEEEHYVEVHSIGRSGWFTGVISLFFLGITLLCAFLFLPSVRKLLQSIGLASFEGFKRLFEMANGLIVWLMNLIPPSKSGETAPPSTVGTPVNPEEEEEVLLNIPYEWIIGIAGLIGIVVFIWFVSRFLKQWKRPTMKKPTKENEVKGPFLVQIKNKIIQFIKKIRKKWMKRFSTYYKEPIYWNYYQLKKWGKKQGFHSLPSETSKEYIEKIINGLQLHLSDEESDPLVSRLLDLSKEYHQTYYGDQLNNSSNQDYTQLFEQLKVLKLNDNK